MNRKLFNVYLPLVLVLLLIGVGAVVLVSPHFVSRPPGPDKAAALPPGKTDVPETPVLTENRAGWWEATGLIYHGIPTRLLFHLPKPDRGTADRVNAKAWREFERIGRIFNPFDPASELARINSTSRTQAPPFQLPVSKDIYAVMKLSRNIWTASNGNFDPTVWPLKQLWRNAEKNQQLPSVDAVRNVLASMGFEKVRLVDGDAPMIHIETSPVLFDFGGVVKGYAVDQVRRLIAAEGADAGLVQLGGEIATFGRNQDGSWRIGIQHPRDMDKVWGVIEAKGGLRVSTSGNYRQAIQIGDRSFYHIFSPKTGWPVPEKILGVSTACLDETVSNARLDGMATAITVMGAEKGLALAEKLGIAAVILYETADGGIGAYVTHNLKEYYTAN